MFIIEIHWIVSCVNGSQPPTPNPPPSMLSIWFCPLFTGSADVEWQSAGGKSYWSLKYHNIHYTLNYKVNTSSFLHGQLNVY